MSNGYKCIFCAKPAKHTKYLGIPGYIMVPNAYDLCDDHEDKWLKYEDVYEPNGKRKPIKFDVSAP